ncbi:MAG: restriction endonuclease [Clostridia bacterium]|nr:restriction endonuclease [Clostridia bacterium]
MTYRIERKKWILYRHTNNFDLITAVATNLKFFSKTSISKEDKLNLLLKLKNLSFYKERNPELPLDSINHRINTLAYYMFGYKDIIDGQNRFLFSPLGNLFLKNIDNKNNLSKIFFTMLWGLQFEHPHGGSDVIFNLYPFRLVFKLLTDKRIENKLYAYEFSYLVVFVENINNESYEKLVDEILKMRKWNNSEIEKAFKKDQHTYVNSAYEWDYYVSDLFQNAGILKKTEGEVICKLLQGKSTYRKITRNFVELNENIISLCHKLQETYSFEEKPLNLEDPERLKIDVVKQIYNFYPSILLDEIGEQKNDLKYGLLNLAKLIEKYSNNNDGSEAYLFEDILTEGFNMFVNVEAKKISGAGNTDIECLYITKKKKFAVEAKSTKNKLSLINSGRLAQHGTKIGSEYTIVVTPRYVPSVLYDIKSSPIVIIRASTFSEYLYNHINNEIREIDYSDFDDIIVSNLGKDISRNISNLTINKFSVKN